MEVCENCGKVIGLKETPCLYKTRVVCEPCHSALVVGTPAISIKPKTEIVQANIVVPTGMYTGPQCQLCGHPMIQTTIGTHAVLHAIAMICLFFFGLGVMFVLPVIGWLVGGTLIVVSLVKSNHRRRILMCRNCGAIADRKYAILFAFLFVAGCQSASTLSVDKIQTGMSLEEIKAMNNLELVSKEGNATTYRTQVSGYKYYPNKFSKLSGIGFPASASWLLTFQNDRLVSFQKDDGYDHQVKMEKKASDMNDSIHKIERIQTDFALPR